MDATGGWGEGLDVAVIRGATRRTVGRRWGPRAGRSGVRRGQGRAPTPQPDPSGRCCRRVTIRCQNCGDGRDPWKRGGDGRTRDFPESRRARVPSPFWNLTSNKYTPLRGKMDRGAEALTNLGDLPDTRQECSTSLHTSHPTRHDPGHRGGIAAHTHTHIRG